MKNFMILLTMLLLSTTTLFAQTNNDKLKGDNISLDSTVRYGKLENGFTYYLKPNFSAKEQIEMHLIFKAGSWHEDNEDQRSYAHLLEHMGAKNTKNFPDVRSYFRQKGAYSHAGTAYEYTDYNLKKIPSNNKQLLLDGFHWMKDLTNNISLEQSSIDVERGAVLGEGRTSNPHNWWEKMTVLTNQSFKNTNYDKKIDPNPEERDKHIRNFDREAFIRFYRDWYRPDLAGLTVVGDFNVDSVEVHIKEIFSNLARHKHPRSAQVKVIGKLKLNGKNQYDKVVDTVDTNLRMVFTSKSVEQGNYDVTNNADYKNLLVQDIYENIINKRSEAINDSYDSLISHFAILERYDADIVRLTLQFGSDDPVYIQDRIVSALLLWKQLHTGFTQAELNAAKTQILKAYKSRRQDNFTLSRRYINHFVKNAAAPGAKRELAIVTEVLKEIELYEIQSYAQKMEDLQSNKDFMFFKGPEDKVPDFASVKKWVKKADAKKVSAIDPPKPPITSLKGDFNLPTINMEEIMVSENKIGVTSVQLPNNIKLLLKPTAPSSQGFSNSVNVFGYLSPGIPYKNDSHQYAVSTMAPRIIQFAGAGEYTKFELNDFMRKKKIRLQLKTDAFSQSISGSAKMDDIEELFALLNLYVTSPRKDKTAFNAWKKHRQEIMAGTWGRVSSGFYMDSVKVRQYPDLPAYSYADVKALKMEEVYNAFAERFSNFDGYTFIITGDFNTNELVPKIIQYISALPVTGKKPSMAESIPKFDLKKKDEKIRIPNTNQVVVHLSFPFLAKQDTKSKIIYKLLGDALKERIFKKLREGCYSPTAYGRWLDKKRGIYTFSIRFDSELGYEKKLIQYAKEEFRNLREQGIEEDWLKGTMNNNLSAYGRRIDHFSYSSFWEGYLQEKLENNEDITTEVLQYNTIMEHFISLDDVNTAAKKYLTEENLQQFLVLPKGYQQEE